jgi:serine/threonine-protein kinase RsbW
MSAPRFLDVRSRCILADCEGFVMAGSQTEIGGPLLRLAFAGVDESCPLLEIEAWIPSDVKAISPLVGRLMRLIEVSHCITGNEPAVELALQEALSNAVVHGNRMDAQKLVQVCCRFEAENGLSLIVKDQGQGFDPSTVPDPFAPKKLKSENGRGIHLMKLAMDEVSFGRGGTEVCMRKGPRK